MWRLDLFWNSCSVPVRSFQSAVHIASACVNMNSAFHMLADPVEESVEEGEIVVGAFDLKKSQSV